MCLDTLRSLYIFKSFDDANLEKLAKICQIKSFAKNSILFYEGDPSKSLYILTSGAICVNKTDPRGNEILLHQFFPVSFIAERATFQGINFPATAKFIEDGAVLDINYEPFREQFLRDCDILFEITKSLCNKIRYLETTITNQLTLDSTARVAKFLYENKKLSGAIKQTQIANELNITPETLSRTLKKFRLSGIISNGKNFEILDRQKLKELF